MRITDAQVRRAVAAAFRDAFKEGDHPRAANGEFGSGGGGEARTHKLGGWSGEHEEDWMTGEISYPGATDTAKHVAAEVAKLPTIKSGKQSGYKENPLPQVERKPVPESVKKLVDTGGGVVKEVDPSKLVSGQPWVDGMKMVKMTAMHEDKFNDPAMAPTAVERSDGTYRILDGNHRAALASMLGRPLNIRIVHSESA